MLPTFFGRRDICTAMPPSPKSAEVVFCWPESVIEEENDRDLHGNAHIAAAFALHQSAGGAEAGFGAFGGNWLIEDKVSTQGKGATDGTLSVDEGDRDGSFVTGRATGTFQDLGGHIFVGTVDDDGFITLPGKFADCGLAVAAGFHADFEVGEDAAKNANDLIVRANYQGLQTHINSSERKG